MAYSGVSRPGAANAFAGIIGSLFKGFGGGAGSDGGTGFSLTTTGGLFDNGGYTGAIDTRAVAGVVHGREFVVKASETARHRPLLEAINAGRFPGYEGGGFVGPSSPSGASPIGGMASAAGMARPLNVTVENHAAGVTHEVRQGLTEDDVRIIARQESAKQVRDQTPTVVASQIGDRNSKVSKALSAHTGAGRRLSG